MSPHDEARAEPGINAGTDAEIDAEIARLLRALDDADRPAADRAADEYAVGDLLPRRRSSRPRADREAGLRHLHRALELAARDPASGVLGRAAHRLGELHAARARARDDPQRGSEHEKALARFEQALQARPSGFDDAARAETLHALGIAVARGPGGRTVASVARTVACLREALEHLSGREHPDRWARLNLDLATSLGEVPAGDPAENAELAREHLLAAQGVWTQEARPTEWAWCEYQLGVVHDQRLVGDRAANLDRAVGHFEAALAVACEGVGDTGRDEHGRVLRSLGLALFGRHELSHHDDDLRRAVASLEESMRVRGRGRYPHEWALTAELLALLHATAAPSGDGAGAAGLLRAQLITLDETAAAHRAAHDEDGVALNAAHRALVLEKLDEHDPADHRSERVEIFAQLLRRYTVDTDPQRCATFATQQGRLLAELDRWTEAADAFGLAVRASEVLLTGTSTRAGREDRRERGDALARSAAYALARVGRHAEAVVVLERGRARILGERLGGDTAALDALRALDPGLVATYLDVHERLRAVQDTDVSGSVLRRGRGDEPGEASAEGLAELARTVRGVRGEYDAVVAQIRRHEGFADFLRAPELADVLGATEPGCPLAYLLATEWGSLVLLVGAPQVTPIWAHGLTEAGVTGIVMRSGTSRESAFPFLSGFALRQMGLVETAFPDGSSALTVGPAFGRGSGQRTGREEEGDIWRLGQGLLRPLVRELARAGVSEVVLVACGTLGELPLHTARFDADPAAPCLLDTVDVAFVPSARVLRAARARRARATEAILLGVANPLPHPAPLTWAEHELARIRDMFDHATALAGVDATRAAVLRAAPGSTHVHLACHGTYVLGDHSPRLVLEDGAEIGVLELTRDRPFAGARLVTLSACQSAIPASRGATEEIDGLPAAILVAGTPAVVATLWPVDDLSTALLMERFYRLHLHGDLQAGDGPLPPHRALARAQRWLARVSAGELYAQFAREAGAGEAPVRSPSAHAARHALRFARMPREDRPYAETWFWAPFVLVGA